MEWLLSRIDKREQQWEQREAEVQRRLIERCQEDPRHAFSVHSHAFPFVLHHSHLFSFSCFLIPYHSPLFFHIAILSSSLVELDHCTELSTQPDYIVPFYCFIFRTSPSSLYISVHLCHPCYLIVYFRDTPLGSLYCSLPYRSPYKL